MWSVAEIVAGLVRLANFLADWVRRRADEAAGRTQAQAEALHKEREHALERRRREEEVAGLSDSDVHQRLDRWLRDRPGGGR